MTRLIDVPVTFTEFGREAIADKEISEQIIYGRQVHVGNKYFGSERVANATDRNMQLIPRGIDGIPVAIMIRWPHGIIDQASISSSSIQEQTSSVWLTTSGKSQIDLFIWIVRMILRIN